MFCLLLPPQEAEFMDINIFLKVVKREKEEIATISKHKTLIVLLSLWFVLINLSLFKKGIPALLENPRGRELGSLELLKTETT
jgi:hypothetical protein